MLQQVEQHRQEIAAICRKYGVIRLDLFGSAASGQLFSSESDIDFFFEFDANPVGLADRYFGLIEDLELLLANSVYLRDDRVCWHGQSSKRESGVTIVGRKFITY